MSKLITPQNKKKSNGKGAKICAIIFTIVGMIVGIRLIFPTIVGIYALTKIANAEKKKDLDVCVWVTAIFCNLIAGICIACMKFPEEEKTLTVEPKQDNNEPKINIDDISAMYSTDFTIALKKSELKDAMYDVLLSYGLNRKKSNEICNNIVDDDKFENYTEEQIYTYIIQFVPNKEPDMDTFEMVFNSLLDKLCKDEALKMDISSTFSVSVSPKLYYAMQEELKDLYNEQLNSWQTAGKNIEEFRFNYTASALGILYGVANMKILYNSAELLKKNICDYAVSLGYKFNF